MREALASGRSDVALWLAARALSCMPEDGLLVLSMSCLPGDGSSIAHGGRGYRGLVVGVLAREEFASQLRKALQLLEPRFAQLHWYDALCAFADDLVSDSDGGDWQSQTRGVVGGKRGLARGRWLGGSARALRRRRVAHGRECAGGAA